LKILKGDASFLLLGLIIFLLASGITISIIVFRSNPVEEAFSTNRVINVLFVIENNKMPISTYVLMYYPVTKRAAIFDIPEDLGLLIAKINRVDRIDRVYDPQRLGNYQNEIEKLLGVEITFSFIITKENLVSIVDMLEGVEIFIPAPVSYRDDEGIILFPSGMTVLDGDKASLYATYSLPHEDSEMSVFRRQRFFLGYLHRQIQMNERLNNPQAAKMYHTFFRTSMNQHAMTLLLDEFVNIDTDRTNIQSVGGNLREVSGQMLIIPHWDGNLVKEVVRQTLGTLTREMEENFVERNLTVEVLNGTAVNGLAGRTAEMLRSFGFDIISIGNADRSNYEDTLIIQRTSDETLAKSFSDVIRCNNIRKEITPEAKENETLIHDTEYKADITLLIGRNFKGRYVIGN
jgi:anionic cell wall polymer biosynthesis LytR-Cps2A-Psr (LCP) family protein